MKLKFFWLILAVFTINGCRKGCTDCNAANYNPDVRRDDGTCEYKRDRFIGKFDVLRLTYMHGSAVPAPFWSNSGPDVLKYYVVIDTGSDAIRLSVDNIDGFGVSFEGVVYPDDNDTFSFDFEIDDFHYWGEVNVEDDFLSLTYSYSYLGGLTYDCVVEGAKVN